MPIEPSIHPFPGLRPFEADEQDLFFGREGQSEEILGRLRAHKFVAVVGASGSGKSSLIRAGLLPYLHGGFLAQAGSHWRIAIFRPGGDPIKNLAAALDDPAVLGKPLPSRPPPIPAEGLDADAAAQSKILLEVSLRRSGLGLIDAVRLARLPEDEQLLIVVDQFEELFRFADAAGRPEHEEDAAAFVKLLLEAGQQRELPIYIVLTMRSDYIGDCARYRGLPEAVTNALYLIPRMTRDQRRAAIVEPVRVGGGTIAPRLVVRLLNDVGDDPDQLPILQHAMMRTWDYWKAHGGGERAIDVDDYTAIGGMADALSQHADEAYAGLPDDRYRAIARRLFQSLSEKGADSREVRRPTTVGALAKIIDVPVADIIHVVDDFRAPGRSFLTPAQGVALTPDSVIDISHESLIRGWRRMRQWVEEEAESARVYRRLADTASLYAQGTAGLLRDPDLEHALNWRGRERPTAEWGQRYHPGFEPAMAFLEQSRLARDSERRQRHVARRRVQIASSFATAAIAVVAVVALWQWHDAKIETDRAQQEEQTAAQERDAAEQARSSAEEARRNADREADHAKQALSMTTKIANALVFDFGQDPGFQTLPAGLRNRILDGAIQGYTQVIALTPTSDAYNGRGAAYYAEGKLEQAIADYDQAVKLDPTDAAAFNNRGNAYDDKGDFDHAIADYNQAIAINPQYANAYYNRGLAYYHKKDYDHAIADYTQALKFNPRYATAYNNRGLAYYHKDDYDHAIADYNQAIALDPQYAHAYGNRGLAYRAEGKLDLAIADYLKAIALDPKNAINHDNLGDAYNDKGDLDRAIAEYTQAITLDPRYAVADVDRGNVYFAKGDYQRSIADYSQAIRIDPNYAFAYRDRGRAYQLTGDLDRAIADYTQAIKLDPKYADAYNDRGTTYDDEGKYDLAIADYTQAIALNPQFAYAYNNRGLAYRHKGDLVHAIADYTQAITLDPKYATGYNNRGNVYFAEGDYDRAIADYTQAIAIDPKYDVAYRNRGRAYQAKGDYDHAIADYTQAITLDPKYIDAYNDRGTAYDDKGAYDQAIADYTQAIALNPKFVYAYNNRGLSYYHKSDYDRAIEDYDAAIALDPKYAHAYDNRGDAYRAKGNLSHAIADYTQAIAIDPKYVDAYNDRGNAYEDRGDYDHAIADYTQALALDPKFAVAYRNRGLAYVGKGDFDHAIADYTQAIVLNPKYTAAYIDRGLAYYGKGDYDHATADYTQGIALNAKSSFAFFDRALTYYYAGSLPKALADLQQSITLNPGYAYATLWLDIVNRRSNQPSVLAQTAGRIDMSKWPAPLIRLYLGQGTPADAIAAADNPNAATKNSQLCDANFYTGELALLQHKKDDATRLFQAAASGCPKSYVEWPAAKAELTALGASRD